jgi:hypothetical protein
MGRAPGQAIDLQNLTGAGGVTVERPVQLQDLAHSQPGRQLACLQLDTDHTVQDSAVCQRIKANTRGQLRRGKGAGQRERAGCQRAARTVSGQVFQSLGHGAELGDEVLNQAGDHAGCALLVISHRPGPFHKRNVLATTGSFPAAL